MIREIPLTGPCDGNLIAVCFFFVPSEFSWDAASTSPRDDAPFLYEVGNWRVYNTRLLVVCTVSSKVPGTETISDDSTILYESRMLIHMAVRVRASCHYHTTLLSVRTRAEKGTK